MRFTTEQLKEIAEDVARHNKKYNFLVSRKRRIKNNHQVKIPLVVVLCFWQLLNKKILISNALFYDCELFFEHTNILFQFFHFYKRF